MEIIKGRTDSLIREKVTDAQSHISTKNWLSEMPDSTDRPKINIDKEAAIPDRNPSPASPTNETPPMIPEKIANPSAINLPMPCII